MKTKFYSIDQNNSGGGFVTDDKLCHRIVIEAKNAKDATDIAEGLGCYWNGVDEGYDCECCGDRWSRPHDWDIVDLDKYKKEGYLIYDYSEKEEDWYDKYGHYPIMESPKWRKLYESSSKENFVGKIFFEDIQEYCEFMADKYGWTTPDVRIFYLDGEVKEIERMDFAERAKFKKRRLFIEKS